MRHSVSFSTESARCETFGQLGTWDFHSVHCFLRLSIPNLAFFAFGFLWHLRRLTPSAKRLMTQLQKLRARHLYVLWNPGQVLGCLGESFGKLGLADIWVMFCHCQTISWWHFAERCAFQIPVFTVLAARVFSWFFAFFVRIGATRWRVT